MAPASIRALVLAGSRPASAAVAALEAGGAHVTSRQVADADDCRAALAAHAWDVAISDGLPDQATAEALGAEAEAPPLLVLVDEADATTLDGALRLGAVVCRRHGDPQSLRLLLERAARRSAGLDVRRSWTAFEHGQIAILQRISEGAALEETLDGIARLLERHAEGLCSILLLDPDGLHVRHGAGPSLPPEFIRLIDGSSIGPEAGSCGTAAYRRQLVVVADIATHPYWERYRDLALPFGLRACWSSPIFSSAREVLGTFAVYYREVREPRPDEIAFIRAASDLAALAMQRDRNETALRRSETRYRQLLETTLEGVVAIDLDGVVRFANRRAVEMLDGPEERLIGRGVAELVDASERSRVAGMLARRREGISEQYEIRLPSRHGVEQWAIIAASPIRDEAGAVSGMLGMITDISERRAAEAASRRSEEQLRAMFEGTAVGVAMLDRSMRLVRTNPALQRFLGHGGDDLARRTLLELAHPEDLAVLVERIGRLAVGAEGSFQAECRFLPPSGATPWARLTISLVRQGDASSPYAVMVLEDISEGKRLEEQLRQAERLRALIFDTVDDALCLIGWDAEGRFRFLSANHAMLRGCVCSLDQVIGHAVDELVPQPNLEFVLRQYRTAIAERRTVRWDDEAERGGRKWYGEVTVTPLFEPGGPCTGLVLHIHDITERKQAEEKISAQAALLDHAHDAILLRGLDSTVLYWNQGASRLYGWSAAEATGRKVTDLIYHDPTAFLAAQDEVMRRGRWAGEIRQYAKEGHELAIKGSWTLFRDQAGRPQAVLTINTDISEEVRLRNEITLAQRMESLGTLAGGIAHDFNNILTAIVGNLALAELALPDGHPVRRHVDLAATACGRAEDLVRRIMAFGRREQRRRVPIDLRAVVGEALELVRSTLPAMIEVRTHWDANLPRIVADPSRIHQIVMNLAANAAHAIAGHGTITVRIEAVDLGHRPTPGPAHPPPGRYVRLVFEDTGRGMDERTLARVFEPFFTTKEPGHGTGLGLSVVHGIVQEHGGTIAVASWPGAGTRFTIHFPVAEAATPELVIEAPSASSGRGERILFIDDEPSILALGTQILEGYGYRISGFSDPLAALAAFRAVPDQFDAVLTDFAMPRMTGREFTRAVLAVRPDLPVLVISGYLSPEEERAVLALGVREILRKPESVHTMVHALARLFGRDPAAGH